MLIVSNGRNRETTRDKLKVSSSKALWNFVQAGIMLLGVLVLIEAAKIGKPLLAGVRGWLAEKLSCDADLILLIILTFGLLIAKSRF